MSKVVTSFLGWVAVPTLVILSSASAVAHVGVNDRPVPSHFTVGNQEFDASVGGLRAYLRSIQTNDPALYLQLAPDVAHLEAQSIEAGVLAGAGLAGATALLVYAIAGQTTCVAPPVTDPQFAVRSDAWGRCNLNNMQHVTTFALVGMGALVAGLAAAWAIAPSRADIFGVVNKHNRISPLPLEMQLGYDPATGAGYGGAVLTF